MRSRFLSALVGVIGSAFSNFDYFGPARAPMKKPGASPKSVESQQAAMTAAEQKRKRKADRLREIEARKNG